MWSPAGAYVCRFDTVTRFEWPIPVRGGPRRPVASVVGPLALGASSAQRKTVGRVLRRGLAVPVWPLHKTVTRRGGTITLCRASALGRSCVAR